jgi:predicted transcriptional regulator
MATVATSVKVPGELKARIDELARRSGKSPHAYVLAALEEHVARTELAEQFLQDAIAADEEMQRSGIGYEAAQVHDYVAAKVRGKKATRPRATRWRE